MVIASASHLAFTSRTLLAQVWLGWCSESVPDWRPPFTYLYTHNKTAIAATTNPPDVRNPVVKTPIAITAGKRTGLNITISGVIIVSAITVPASIRPDMIRKDPPAMAAVAAFTIWWDRLSGECFDSFWWWSWVICGGGGWWLWVLFRVVRGSIYGGLGDGVWVPLVNKNVSERLWLTRGFAMLVECWFYTLAFMSRKETKTERKLVWSFFGFSELGKEREWNFITIYFI